jgi:site-specific DNA-adenine methylase
MKITQAETQAQVAGRLGGCVISAAKQKAAKLNGALGGRPKKFEKQTPPTFGYPGGKAHLARTLVDLMPPSGRRYVEPFAGRGNVFWVASELDYQEWHINDIRTASWFEAIRDHGHDLKVPRCTRMEYYKRWAAYKNGCPYANMLGPLLTYSGGGYGSSGFRNSKKGFTTQGYGQAIRMAQHILRATEATITRVDWKNAVVGLSPDDFVYFDPPYLGCRLRAYTSDDIDHKELIKHLLSAPYRWVLSEYDNPLYRKAFGVPMLQEKARTCRGGLRTECVWCNF